MTIEEITTSLTKGKTIIDKKIEETILEIDKIMAEMALSRDIEIEVRVGKIQEITKMTIQEIEAEIGVETDKCDQELECYLMIEKTGQGPYQTLG